MVVVVVAVRYGEISHDISTHPHCPWPSSGQPPHSTRPTTDISAKQVKANVNQNTNELEIKAFMMIRKIIGTGLSRNLDLVLVVGYGQSSVLK